MCAQCDETTVVFYAAKETKYSSVHVLRARLRLHPRVVTLDADGDAEVDADGETETWRVTRRRRGMRRGHNMYSCL